MLLHALAIVVVPSPSHLGRDIGEVMVVVIVVLHFHRAIYIVRARVLQRTVVIVGHGPLHIGVVWLDVGVSSVLPILHWLCL